MTTFVPSPLRIHIGQEGELVIFGNTLITNLLSLKLEVTPENVKTTFNVIGCYPTNRQDALPDQLFSNATFPLRIYVGNKPDDVMVWLHGKAVSHLTHITLDVFDEGARRVDFTFDAPVPEELRTLLNSLSVHFTAPA